MCGGSTWFMQSRCLEYAASLKAVMFPGTNATGQAPLKSVPGRGLDCKSSQQWSVCIGRPDCQTQGHALIQAECDPLFLCQ